MVGLLEPALFVMRKGAVEGDGLGVVVVLLETVNFGVS
jgi:hypothetical protein